MCVSLWDSNFFLLALVRADFTFPLVYLVFYRCRCQVIKMRIILGHLLKIHAFHYHLLSSGVRFFQHELQYTPGLLCSYSLCSTDFHFIFYIYFNSLQLCCACATFCSSHCCSSFSTFHHRGQIFYEKRTHREVQTNQSDTTIGHSNKFGV